MKPMTEQYIGMFDRQNIEYHKTTKKINIQEDPKRKKRGNKERETSKEEEFN